MGKKRFPVGLRTVKTAIAIIVALMIVSQYGATSAKLIFAMLGAMSAVQLTIRESWNSCISQILGVLIGAVFGIILSAIPINSLVAIGVGIILIITLYSSFRILLSPTLPCLILVMICTSADVAPAEYAAGRIWDTAIGLAVGMLVNVLIFPYDNSRGIRRTVESLEKDVLTFLEEMFAGDRILPKTEPLINKVDDLEEQLRIFRDQRVIFDLRRRREKLERFQIWEKKARALLAELLALGYMEQPGALSDENRQMLIDSGAVLGDERRASPDDRRDVVTNYHVARVLQLRQELLRALSESRVKKKK